MDEKGSSQTQSQKYTSIYEAVKRRYVQWTLQSAENVSHFENMLRFGLYFIPGRYGDQELLYEFLLSVVGMVGVVHDSIWTRFSVLQSRIDEEQTEVRKLASLLGDSDGVASGLMGPLEELGERWAKQFGALQTAIPTDTTNNSSKGLLESLSVEFRQKLRKISRRLHPSLTFNFPIHFLLSAINNFELVCEIVAHVIQQKLSRNLSILPPTKNGDVVVRVSGGWLSSYKANLRLIVIFMIELLKAFLRLLLLIKNEGKILAQQSLPNRDSMLAAVESPPPAAAAAVQKKRITLEAVSHARDMIIPSAPSFYSVLGEILWIIRPIIYLISLIKHGRNSWKPWFLSLLIDLASRACTLGAPLSESESNEMARRMVMWFFYILRSPFYETFVSSHTGAFQGLLKVPLLGGAFGLISELVNVYRKWYFYTSGSSS